MKKTRKRIKPVSEMSTLADALEVLKKQEGEQQEILLKTCKEHWLADEHLPKQLLKDFAWSGKGAEWLKSHHPFSTTFEAMTQITMAHQMLVQARASLVELYGHYHATLIYDGFTLNKEVDWKTTHEVFKYVFAASALVQAYRRLLSCDYVDREGYRRVFEQAFQDAELMAFVQKLRNCYGHQMLLQVASKGKITYRQDVTVESALTFDRELLLSLPPETWNKEAKQYLEKTEKLNVLDIINDYHKMASQLFHSYGSATGAYHAHGFREIMRCKQAIKAASHLMSLGIMLQGAKKRGTDPYAHLAKHFTDDEMARIFCFPSHSRDQVDFLITLRDPLGLCDDSTKQSLYELFHC